MEKSDADKDSTGVCEKIYNAVARSPAFRAIHRKSGPAQSSVVTNREDSNQLSSLQEGKTKQERAASPNIIVIQGHDQGTNVSPGAEPTKTVSHIPILGVQENPKLAVLKKTMSEKLDYIIHPDKSDNRESKDAEQVPATDGFSDYIAHVKRKMRTLSNAGKKNENERPATRFATRRDSFNDRVVNYINRATKNFRTPSNVGDT